MEEPRESCGVNCEAIISNTTPRDRSIPRYYRGRDARDDSINERTNRWCKRFLPFACSSKRKIGIIKTAKKDVVISIRGARRKKAREGGREGRI
jgi:hypothetical protein